MEKATLLNTNMGTKNLEAHNSPTMGQYTHPPTTDHHENYRKLDGDFSYLVGRTRPDLVHLTGTVGVELKTTDE